MSNPTIIPVLRYKDANAALDFLQRAFGFEEKEVHRGEDGSIGHAELRLAGGVVMVNQHRPGGWFGDTEPDAAASPAAVYVCVPDPDAHHATAKAAGADVEDLVDQDYGAREYTARDLEGNLWSFGTYDPYAG